MFCDKINTWPIALLAFCCSKVHNLLCFYFGMRMWYVFGCVFTYMHVCLYMWFFVCVNSSTFLRWLFFSSVDISMCVLVFYFKCICVCVCAYVLFCVCLCVYGCVLFCVWVCFVFWVGDRAGPWLCVLGNML